MNKYLLSHCKPKQTTCLNMGMQMRFPGHRACLSLNLTVL